MKDQKFNSNEKEFLDGIQEFFGNRTVINHLTFIDKWMMVILGGKPKKRWTKPADLYYFYERIEKLFETSYHLQQSAEGFVALQASAKVQKSFLAKEKQTLAYFPYQLREQELLSPLKTIRTVFKRQDLHYYQKTLREWLGEGLNDQYVAKNADYIIPLYTNAKRLVTACWLIHERVTTKNSFKKLTYTNPLLNFALSEPHLFSEEEIKNPYLMVEDFFNFTNLSGYREELQDWFMTAINENLTAEKPNDCLFMYNQYTQLIQAGYLIVSQELTYVPKPHRCNGKTMGQWMLGVKESDVKKGKIMLSDEEPHILSLAERADPMAYCTEALSHDKMVKLRLGLYEWLDAGLSENSSIHGSGNEYAYDFYLTLQKLTEAFYLIITANATSPVLPLTPIGHED